jgi:hypothetical protein
MVNRRYLLPFSPGALRSSGSVCPRCNAAVFRVSRRFIDLFVSLFVPVRRYRCISMECNWEGNLRMKRTSLPVSVRAKP